MGKRSNFERKPRDFYRTPHEAVAPLIKHLPDHYTFLEPCAGDGALVEALEALSGGHCVYKSDIEPQCEHIWRRDALKTNWQRLQNEDFIITNPPWDRKVLHPMIERFSRALPTWLLFDADWMHTKQSAKLMLYCHKIVSVGRVKWIPNSKMTGKDNCCWYLFDRYPAKTEFFGR